MEHLTILSISIVAISLIIIVCCIITIILKYNKIKDLTSEITELKLKFDTLNQDHQELIDEKLKVDNRCSNFEKSNEALTQKVIDLNCLTQELISEHIST